MEQGAGLRTAQGIVAATLSCGELTNGSSNQVLPNATHRESDGDISSA